MDIMANTLKEARKAKGLNQSELAHLSGTDQSHISRLERGEKGASTEVLNAIARVLGLSLSKLLGEEVREADGNYANNHPAQTILSNYNSPAGLRELATDKKLADALNITPEEWESLASIKLSGGVSKDGYVQLLITMRAVSDNN